MRSLLTLMILMSVATGALAAPPGTGDPVLDCMRANVPESLRIQEVRVLSTDRDGGERELRGRMFGSREGGEVRVMFRIEAPTDLAGASYLIREAGDRDDMYLYLPAINKVRRIRGGRSDSRLFGTDLSYDDIKQVQNAYSAGTVVHGDASTEQGRAVHVLQLTPRDQDSRYRRIELKVDQQTCVALAADFHEADGVRKQLRVDPAALKQSGAFWYAEEQRIRDLQDGTETRLTVTDVRSDPDLSARYFNPRMFHLGH